MQRNLVLGVVLSVFLAAGAFAQSSSKSQGSKSKGSESRGSSGKTTTSMSKKEARMIAKQEAKLVGKIARRDFAAVDLTRAQKQTLKNLVHAKFSEIQQLEKQVADSVPADKAKALKKAYRIATKGGQSKSEAMATSMMKAGFDETLKQKILGFNQSKENLIQGIRDALAETLDGEQKEMLAKAAKAKMEMDDSAKEEKKSMKKSEDKIT